ncbi:MAG: hypothetical protein A2017_18090 [Lentisphaerae bacterium GWF2_44_16]|nr:MAG: hypothetical protein A2017_18090 [Lentisphaerae bacterium GWF2_44_16]
MKKLLVIMLTLSFVLGLLIASAGFFLLQNQEIIGTGMFIGGIIMFIIPLAVSYITITIKEIIEENRNEIQ